MPYSEIAIQQIREGTRSVIEKWRQLHPRKTRKRPLKTLYHYTSPAGFLGIVSQEQMRASHILGLNDYSEYFYAAQKFRELAAGRSASSIDELEKGLLREILRQLESLTPADIPGVFVVCFTERKNDLGQWRGYGEGEGGVSLGFDLDELRVSASSHNCFGSFELIYKKEHQIHLLAGLLAWAIAEWPKLAARCTAETLSHTRECWVSDFLFSIGELAPLFKDHSFKHEKEWRLILHRTADEAVIVAGRRGLTGYALADLRSPVTGCMPLREVWMGPGPFTQRDQVAAIVALRQKGYERIAHWLAGIPFRK